MAWSQPLIFPITLNDGRVLRTIGEAAELLVNFGETIRRNLWVPYAAELLMQAAETADLDEIEQATLQVQAALRQEGMIGPTRRGS